MVTMCASLSSSARRKLAHSALHRIRALISDFEKDDAFDRRVALIGGFLLVALLGVAVYFLFVDTGVTLTLS